MTRDHRLRFLSAVLALLATSCLPRARPPAAADTQPAFPDFGGRTVMVLPVQSAMPLVAPPANADTSRRAQGLTPEQRAALDSEIAFWLSDNANRVEWVHADAVERAVKRSPSLNVRVHDLPVRDFLRSRVESIGDPLYGDLRAVGLVSDARYALLPIGALWIPEIGGSGRIHLAVALIDTMGGRVFWQGVVAGTPGTAIDQAATASAARALAELIR